MTGEELREKRQAKGLGQRELAKISGVSQRDISRIECGRKKASEKVVKRLTEVLK
jgi:transcriptional regulator with XRE-family HTH domain